MYCVDKGYRNPIRQQFCGCPHVIGYARSHRWGDRLPGAHRPGPPCGFRPFQAPGQARMGQHHVIGGQSEPHMRFQPWQFLPKATRLAGQPPGLLPQGQVFPLDKTGVDRRAGGHALQTGVHGRSTAKHGAGRHRNHLAPFALRAHLRVPHVWWGHPPRGRGAAPRALPGWVFPSASDVQQRRALRRQLVTGKAGGRPRRDMRHPFPQPIGTGLGACADHKRHDQPPDGRNGDPHPGITGGRADPLGSETMRFFRMHKAPPFVQVTFGDGQLVPQIPHDQTTMQRGPAQPIACRVRVDVDDPGCSTQRIAFGQGADGRRKHSRIGVHIPGGCARAYTNAAATGATPGLFLPVARAMFHQPALWEGPAIRRTRTVRTVQCLPVHDHLAEQHHGVQARIHHMETNEAISSRQSRDTTGF